MKPWPKYARRFKGKASLIRVGDFERSALLCATRNFRAWKKVVVGDIGGVIALTIPKAALFWVHREQNKCRADRAISRGTGRSQYRPAFKYTPGKEMRPARFSKSPKVCAGGIHFFASRSAAARYAWC